MRILPSQRTSLDGFSPELTSAGDGIFKAALTGCPFEPTDSFETECPIWISPDLKSCAFGRRDQTEGPVLWPSLATPASSPILPGFIIVFESGCAYSGEYVLALARSGHLLHHQSEQVVRACDAQDIPHPGHCLFESSNTLLVAYL